MFEYHCIVVSNTIIDNKMLLTSLMCSRYSRCLLSEVSVKILRTAGPCD